MVCGRTYTLRRNGHPGNEAPSGFVAWALRLIEVKRKRQPLFCRLARQIDWRPAATELGAQVPSVQSTWVFVYRGTFALASIAQQLGRLAAQHPTLCRAETAGRLRGVSPSGEQAHTLPARAAALAPSPNRRGRCPSDLLFELLPLFCKPARPPLESGNRAEHGECPSSGSPRRMAEKESRKGKRRFPKAVLRLPDLD